MGPGTLPRKIVILYYTILYYTVQVIAFWGTNKTMARSALSRACCWCRLVAALDFLCKEEEKQTPRGNKVVVQGTVDSTVFCVAEGKQLRVHK